MFSTYQLILIVNSLFFGTILAIDFNSRRAMKITASLWAGGLIVLQYILASEYQSGDPRYVIFGLDLPLVFMFALVPILFWLFGTTDQFRPVLVFNAVVFVFVGGLTRAFTAGLALADVGSTPVQQFVYQMNYSVVFALFTFVPMLALLGKGSSLWKAWFSSTRLQFEKIKWKAVVAILSILVGSLILNFLLKGFVVRFYPGLTLKAKFIIILTNLLWFVLVDHFISFVVTREVVNRCAAQMFTEWHVVMLSGLAYAIQHYYLQPAFMVRDLFLGVCFAFLFARTRSLVPGIVINIVFLSLTS